MRSVSIVYRKDRRSSCGSLPAHNIRPFNSIPKRSVDQYYNLLLDKQKRTDRSGSLTQQRLERAKLSTANRQRKEDVYNIFDTLNIAALPLHEQTTDPKKELSKVQTHSNKFVISKKLCQGRPSLIGLNIVPLNQLFEEEQRSGNVAACRLKCLFKQKNYEQKGTVLALSANFILDEHYFWQQQEVEEMAVRHWKLLQNYSNIVWVCRREESFQKISRFSRLNGLRLDAVYLIVPHRNQKLLTVGYGPIENDFQIRYAKSSSPLLLKEEKKLVVINGLLVEDTSELTFSSFYQSVPLLKSSRSVVHFSRIDLSDGSRFGSVVKILSQSAPPRPFDLMTVFREFEVHEEENEIEEDCEASQFQEEQVNVLQRLQQVKKQLINYFQGTLSLKMNQKVMGCGGDRSAQNIIGDTIRRNYRIFKNYQQYGQEYRQYSARKAARARQKKKVKGVKRKSPVKFRNLVYLWEL